VTLPYAAVGDLLEPLLDVHRRRVPSGCKSRQRTG